MQYFIYLLKDPPQFHLSTHHSSDSQYPRKLSEATTIMSSPLSCYSPSSQSTYCSSVYSYNGSTYPHSPNMSNITTPDATSPNVEAFSPLMYGSPSPTLSSPLPAENMPAVTPLPPSSGLFYSPTLGSSPMSPHSAPSCRRDYYSPQPQQTLTQFNGNAYSPPCAPNEPQYTYSSHSTPSAPSSTTSSPYGSFRRSLPPIDASRFEEEEWFTPNGKKVRHSAMHLHCATM